MKYASIALAALISCMAPPAHAEAQKVTVLELYTSQGCSSCPPADALLHKLSSEDPSLLLLSFHVDYWNYLGWKDPFSSPVYSARQQAYVHALGEKQIYTPELIVDGKQTMPGSEEGKVRQAIAAAKANLSDINITIAPSSHSNQLTVAVSSSNEPNLSTLEVWEIRYNRMASTSVEAGENSGHKLTSTNNVTALSRLGTLDKGQMTYTVDAPSSSSEGIAIITQRQNHGPILNAAYYSTKTSL